MLGNRHSARIDTDKGGLSQEASMILVWSTVYDAMMGLRRFLFGNVYLNKNAEMQQKRIRQKILLKGFIQRIVK